MTVELIIPLAAALALSLVVTAVHGRLPPAIATRITTATLAVSGLAALATTWLVSLVFIAHLPLFGGRLEWCAMAIGVHRPLPAVVGLPVVILAIWGTARAVHIVRLYRRLATSAGGLVEIDDAAPLAYTLPGRGGQIVISSGLRAVLTHDEFAAVLAHESVHVRYRHDRHLIVARLAQAALPVLRPLSARVQFSIERWADEQAARQVGARSTVASALAKVALYGCGDHLSPTVPAFARLGVTRRVEALLADSPARPRRAALGSLWAGVGAVAVLSTVQLHHLGVLIAALCPT